MTLQRLNMVADLIDQRYSDYSLLDLGCRTSDLKPFLKSCREYHGTDIVPGEGILECDLEENFPFANDSVDVVCVLDVLEHLENCHAAIKEALRVARKAVLISLPNIHYISFRWRFVRGNGISGKYTFHPHPIGDRHRWVLSYDEAIQFVDANTDGYAVRHYDIVPQRGRTRFVSSPIEKWLAAWRPNLFVYGVISEIRLDNEP